MTSVSSESCSEFDGMPSVSDEYPSDVGYQELLVIFGRLIKENEENVDIIMKLANAFCHRQKYENAMDVYARAFSLGTVGENHLAEFIEALYKSGVDFMETTSQKPCDVTFCDLCSGILIQPLTLPCGHTYCKTCLLIEVDVICKSCHVKYNPVELSVLKVNVTVVNVLEKICSKEVRAAKFRLEGNELYKLCDFLPAVAKYTEAEKLDPFDHLVQYDLSDTLLAVGKPQEALLHAEKSIHLHPTCFKGYLCKGASLVCLGQHDEAIIAFLRCYMLGNASTSLRSDTIKKDTSSLIWKNQKAKLESIVARFQAETQEMKDDCVNANVRPEGTGTIRKKDLECSLCIRLLWQPVTTPCGHVYCRTCLDRCLDHKPHCPLCKQSLADYLAERRHATTELIETIIMKYLPDDYKKRKRCFEDELEELSSAGKDPEHGVPLFVCTLAYPDIRCPLHIFEPRYRLMTRQCMESGTREFGMCVKHEEEPNGIARFGTMLAIRDMGFYPDGRSIVDAIGTRRFKVLDTSMRDGYHVGSLEFISDCPVLIDELEAVKQCHDEVYSQVSDWFSTVPSITRSRILQHFGPLPLVQDSYITSANGPQWMWWTLAILPIDVKAQVRILGITSLKKRLQSLQRVLQFVRRFGPQGISQ